MAEATIILLAVLLVLSAVFSGTETAMFSLNDAKVRNLEKKKKRGAKKLRYLKEHPHKLLITILIGNNVVNIGASAIAAVLITGMFGSAGVGIATGVMTFLILVFGEITPKSFSHQNAEKVSLAMAVPVWLLMKALAPAVWILEKFTRLLIVLAGSKEGKEMSNEEIKTVVSMGRESGIIKRHEEEMIHHIFDFGATTAEEVMTPRVEMVAASRNMRLNELINLMLVSGFSRIPIYDGSKENIVGISYVKDALPYLKRGRTGIRAGKIMRKPFFVPETKNIDLLLDDFRKKRLHMAIVVKETGGVEGLITIEDLLEEIVGEIYDETDIKRRRIRKIGKMVYMLDPRASIELVNTTLHVSIPKRNFITVSGLIISKLGRIPAKNETVRAGSARFRVIDVKNGMIRKIRVEKVGRRPRKASRRKS